nr:MAG TPA: hypothetical protein [Caudoviricetes sp.]
MFTFFFYLVAIYLKFFLDFFLRFWYNLITEKEKR